MLLKFDCGLILEKEKDFLLNCDCLSILNNTINKSILISLFGDITYYNKYSLIYFYNISLLLTCFAFPRSIAVYHKQILNSLVEKNKNFSKYLINNTSINLLCYKYEYSLNDLYNSEVFIYRYSICLDNTHNIWIKDSFTNKEEECAIAHYKTHSYFSREEYNEFLFNMLILYTDFVKLVN